MDHMDEAAAAKLESQKQALMDELISTDKCLFADGEYRPPVRFNVTRPKDVEGNLRDQTPDAARHMRYAASLGLQQLPYSHPHGGTAIICGGGPSIKDNLDKIKELAKNPDAAIFALNWTHNWLIKNGV